ncbi:hypothetical protein [Photorhabdus khanii]|uniref:Uncharacterized protein n=1 Tax=Photorhabdus khanii subsp. guanajuatensis TaxID=2100166 RepID=A0A4V2X5I1_9GAMM|nr:hypothetical protein [Photorhabdus khanii]TDB48255.1 hypothetical protein C5467_19475 [Photorhabdus khanii subsp. guanajuatensis]
MSRTINEAVRELEISITATERIMIAMLQLLSPVQKDALKDILFSECQIASEIIPTDNEQLIKREKQITEKIHTLLQL